MFVLLFTSMNIAAQQFSNENFIYTEAPQKAVQSSNYNTLSKTDIQRNINYFDGLGRLKQSVGISQGANKLDNNLLDWKNNWTLGIGAVSFFTENGQLTENLRINGLNPFGKTDRLWRCVNDAASDADGGWNTSLVPIDKTQSYQYAVWVKRTGGQNGTTFHGTQNVVNLDGTANGNPYFWYGNLPALDTWYLMVGLIQPSTYAGGYSGISGVYDMAGNKVLSGTDFKWSSTTTNSYFRSYLYYAADVAVSQYFYNPVLQKIDNNQASILGLVKGFESSDIITHNEYDNLGRQAKEYLPYAVSGTGGLIQTAPLTDVLAYYNTTKYENTANPFSEKSFESSPLSRVLKQAAPGNSWKTQLTSGHEVKLDYQTNSATEVKQFIAVSTDNLTTLGLYNPSITQTINYNAGELYKTVTKDENWISGLDRTTEEFKDKEGRVVLKRTYDNQVPHDTYYVYDQYGNLSYVLPPLANGAFDDTTLNNLCYRYKYDYRNRLVEKKLPGKEWEYIVYDKLDRPILTQDANLRIGKKWLFTKYDAFNRPVYTGEYVNSVTITRKAVQDLATASVAALNEQAQGATVIGDATAYYSNASFPNTDINLNIINYYDNYSFDLIGPLPSAVVSYGITPVSNAKGLATGSKVRVLEKAKWITNVIYYDVKGRPIYNYNYNDYLQITSTVKSNLDFTGKATETTSTHTGVGVTTTVVDGFTYDHTGRRLVQKQKINSQPEEIIASNTYDDLGQLVLKSVGGKTSQNRLQNVDYSYNVRGWLKGINNVNAIGTDLFAFQVSYDIPVSGGTALYNGNISQTFWRTANADTSLRNYNYTYDALNRLAFATDNLGNYNENPTYDKNGNIKTLFRKGNTVPGTSSFGTIDDLIYTYNPSDNRLIKVEDSAPINTEGFKNGSTATTEYTYDDNGNMKTDANKGIITDINYNYLNLPTDIALLGGTINYVYDATGVKQRKIAGTITTDYANGYQYENNKLKFFPQPEGYAANNAGTFSYIYQYKDHLGNIRLSYGDGNDDGAVNSSEIVEESNYYPFGLRQLGYNGATVLGKGNSTGQKYKYNGKELQDELGLNMYDYGARNYDPALGRWMNIDPLAEKSRRFNPYTYALNNPVYFIDPDGMMAIPTPLEAALMAKHVYADPKDKVELQGGWKPSAAMSNLSYSNGKTGFKSALYERTVDGKTEYTYATAGTEDGKDWKNNGTQLAGASEQYNQSVGNAKALEKGLDGEITFTGHSLGGGLAEANAIATGDSAITFNAAGVSLFTGGVSKKSDTDAYIMTTDPLNAIQQGSKFAVSPLVPTAGGEKHFLSPRNASGIYNGHSINSIIDSLSQPTAIQSMWNTIKQALTPPSFH
ncbi:RHS repeat-associated core domain protein-containing protein [Flavobacterium sp. CF136]|nr:RHS repeat-associated core domain protein-containing protein [Flavobacterium sp. CF136]